MHKSRLLVWPVELAVIQVVLTATWILSANPVVTALTLSGVGAVSFIRFFWYSYGFRRPADIITMLRLTLTLVLPLWFIGSPEPCWAKATLAITVLILDGLDGFVARRTGVTASGAVFDSEADSWFIFSLSILLWIFSGVSNWILIPALIRPVFVLLTSSLRRLRVPLRSFKEGSLQAKVIFVVTALSLILNLSPLESSTVRSTALHTGILLLCWSFAREAAGMIPRKQSEKKQGMSQI